MREELRLRLQAWLDPLVQRVNERAFWYTGAFFDRRYRREDPWRFRDSAYEAARHAALLGALPASHVRRVLEVGCGEGLFTEKLAARRGVERVLGVDVSARAIARARARCAHLPCVELEARDVTRAVPEGPFDAIFCVEVLPYLGDRAAIGRLAAALGRALAPGGALVLSHGLAAARRVHPAVSAGAPWLQLVEDRTCGSPRPWQLAVLREP